MLSEFEFVSVLISMVVGLGITQVLGGVAQAVHERKESPVDQIHMVWTAVPTFGCGRVRRRGFRSAPGATRAAPQTLEPSAE